MDYEDAFWELVYQEYGVVDELDVMNDNIVEIIQPQKGIIILITKEMYE